MKGRFVLLLFVLIIMLVLVAFPTVVLARGLSAMPQAALFKLGITPQSLTMILAGVMALVFDWFPKVAPWYDGLSPLKKRQLMVGVLISIVGLIEVGACYGYFDTGLVCTTDSIPVLLTYILEAAGVNQAVHLLTKPTKPQ